jgi:large subunit ribosomal protein L25
MAATLDTETLDVSARSDHGSRSMRRLRRSGRVPGVIYGGKGEPVAFDADARLMRNMFQRAGALLQVSVDGGEAVPVLIKDVQHHPLRGDIVHADLLRVDMKVAIQAQIPVELTGAEESPGVDQGGILNQEARELTVEALPADMPEVITFDVSKLEMNQTVTLADLGVPAGLTVIGEAEEIVVATITPPTLEPTEDEIETETAVVGEDGEVEESKAQGDTQEEAESAAAGEGNAAESA